MGTHTHTSSTALRLYCIYPFSQPSKLDSATQRCVVKIPLRCVRIPPASVARLLAAQRDPAEWRSGTGREPSTTVVSKASRHNGGEPCDEVSRNRAGRVTS